MQELIDKREVCRLFGGGKPIDASTLYRNVAKGVFPKPIHVAGSSRWLRSEVEACLRSMVERRAA
jgi:predicted DNA-binding transcriptional regulator AlpA